MLVLDRSYMKYVTNWNQIGKQNKKNVKNRALHARETQNKHPEL